MSEIDHLADRALRELRAAARASDKQDRHDHLHSAELYMSKYLSRHSRNDR
jgi:hypothetical protein